MSNTLYCSEEARQPYAKVLTERFGLTLQTVLPQSTYWLTLGSERLSLDTQYNHGAVTAEFIEGEARHRRLQGGGRGQAIAKAVGLKGNRLMPYVVDATAGLGKDSFTLASLGCRVTLLERSPAAAALLWDALQRARANQEVAPIAQRMTLVHANAIVWLTTLAPPEQPDVILVDPMFPEPDKKKAASKKAMQAFQHIIGADEDEHCLLTAALGVARCRVVVKRPRLAPPITGPAPSISLTGKSTRFDIYIKKALAPSHPTLSKTT